MFDLIIIGGSAAATSAAIYAARRKLNFKIVTIDLGGEVATSGIIENWPGIIKTDGVSLAKQFKEHLKAYNIFIDEFVKVQEIKKIDNFFSIKAVKKIDGQESLKYQTKTVIVATGVHPRKLNISGEKEYLHKGLSYCTTCDGPLFAGKVTAVIGGGNSALESALMLSQIASKIYLINKNNNFKGDQLLIEKVVSDAKIEIIYNANTKKVFGNGFVRGIIYEDSITKKEKSLEVQGVFVHIGMVPNSEIVPDVQKNQFSEIIVTKKCETSIPGLFAAGDVTDIPYKQTIISAGQGAIAALSAVEYLNKLR